MFPCNARPLKIELTLTNCCTAAFRIGSVGFWFKLAKEKDMCSSPERASKSQLAVEQPLTGGCWNPMKKDIPLRKTKKLQRDGRRGTITIKPNPIPAGWVTHKLESNKYQRSSPTL